MMQRWISIFALALCACGVAPGVDFAVSARLEQGLDASKIAAVELFLLDSKLQGGAPFNCAGLGKDWVLERSDVVVRYHAIVSFSASRLTDVPPLQGAVLVADAYGDAGATGARIGTGCKDNVTVAAGGSANAAVTIAGLP
jgi:hypothetical protein